MSEFELLGWIGNACFFGRVCLQWWHAERQRASEAPAAFWVLSLAGSVALAVYALELRAFVLFSGYALSTAIYARNLGLQQGRARPLSSTTLSLAALVMTLALVSGGVLESSSTSSGPWIVIALLGQSLWSSRFVVQWWASERALKSHFPRKFWWLSLTGNSLLLAYAFHLGDPVFVAGFLLGPIVQIRNLMLSVGAREHRAQETPAANRRR